MNSIRNFLAKPQRLLVTAVLCLISFMVYAQYAVNYDGTTYKVDPRIWRSNRAEILVELGTNAGGGTIFVTNYVYATNYVYTTNSILVTNFVNTTNFTVSTNFVYTTNYTVTTNYVNITNNPAANVALLDAAYQEFTGSTTKFTGKLISSNAELGDIVANSISTADPFSVNVGGTGARSVGGAQSNLNLVPGTHVQAQSSRLQQIADLSLTNTTILVYSNSLMQVPVSPAGVALLKAADAAAQRGLLSAAEIDNTAYGAGWIGVTTKSPSLDAVYNAISGVSGVSNLIQSVDTNYFRIGTNNNQLQWAGPTNTGSSGGATNLAQLVDTSISSPSSGDILAHNGSAWVNRRVGAFDDFDEWQVIDWTFDGGSTTAMLEPGLTHTPSVGGAFNLLTNYFNGSQAAYARTAKNDTLSTGAYLNCGNVVLVGVNAFKITMYVATTSSFVGLFGWTDEPTFGATEPSDACGFTITNRVFCPIVSSNSVKAVSATTYTVQANTSYDFECYQTNSTARFKIYSNSVVVFDSTVTGVPINMTNFLFPALAVRNLSSTALTNGGTMVVVDRARYAKKMR